MAVIELVIKIPEEIRLALINNVQLSIDQQSICDSCIKQAIVNGTSLPKGHGALKDTDAICKDIISALGIRDESYLLEAEEAIYKIIKNASTIIEPYKIESEDKE